MIEYKINDLRRELDDLIASGATFQEVYIKSLILDKLIVEFYSRSSIKK